MGTPGFEGAGFLDSPGYSSYPLGPPSTPFLSPISPISRTQPIYPQTYQFPSPSDQTYQFSSFSVSPGVPEPTASYPLQLREKVNVLSTPHDVPALIRKNETVLRAENRKPSTNSTTKAEANVKKPRERKKGVGSKSGPANRRIKGGSDDEMSELKPAQKQAAEQLKNVWTDEDKLSIIKHITSEKVWKDFRATKAKDFIYVSIQCSVPDAFY
jgi:hypothetical protein